MAKWSDEDHTLAFARGVAATSMIDELIVSAEATRAAIIAENQRHDRELARIHMEHWRMASGKLDHVQAQFRDLMPDHMALGGDDSYSDLDH